jgi:hypothetical protein
MATITLKVSGADQTFDFPWFQDQYLGNLLGNPRPSSLQDIEKSEYWANLMHDYCHSKGAGPLYDAWANANNKNGPERDALKNAQVWSDRKQQNMEVREAFRKDLGFVKMVYRHKLKQTDLGQEIEATFDPNQEQAEEEQED